MSDDFGIGLAFEYAALGGEFGAQFLVVLDDAVVDDGKLAGRVRVGIGRGRRAVGRPSGMRNADIARRGITGQHVRQIGEPALGTAADEFAILKRTHARAVIAAVFHALEPLDQPVGHA